MLIGEGSPLFAPLAALARTGRLVFVAGLPGTGKSLLLRELAHLAHRCGRRVHLLQWDVARPVFEAAPAGRRYPQERGITHGVIRLAVGAWARQAVARWHATHREPAHLLLGETPFIGHRFIELARPAPDAAEALLASPATRFVIPVPSVELRRHLEAERERRARAPLHPREREDAPPAVLRELWRELATVAAALDIAAPGGPPAYDPALYRRVYERLLSCRHAVALPIDTRLPAETVSAYDLAVPVSDLVPTDGETARFIAAVERSHPGAADVEQAIATWYRPPG